MHDDGRNVKQMLDARSYPFIGKMQRYRGRFEPRQEYRLRRFLQFHLMFPTVYRFNDDLIAHIHAQVLELEMPAHTVVGMADVVAGATTWSDKTVKLSDVPNAPGKMIRIITGRNSPRKSFSVNEDSLSPEQKGSFVLQIHNVRVQEVVASGRNDNRVAILIRDTRCDKSVEEAPRVHFLYFEDRLTEYRASDYHWEINVRDNLEGYDRKTGAKKFTWQPHGAQFTVHYQVPTAPDRYNLITVERVKLTEEEVVALLDKAIPSDDPNA